MMKSIPTGRCAALLAAILLAGCAATAGQEGPPRKEHVLAVTQSHRLIGFNAGQPGRLLSDVALKGLSPGEQVLGIDFRVARGELYALTSTGRLGRIDTGSGQFTPLGDTALPLAGHRFGFDFNPSADRIRIVSDSGQNLRGHPDTGAQVDFDAGQPGVQPDGTLGYADGDPHRGTAPHIAAAAYTYNKDDEKLTTNYAIDLATGALVRQGSVEGVAPVESPNLGKLHTVGSLGVAGVSDAHFDIADLNNAALATLTTAADPAPRLYEIDLATGRATLIGKVGSGEPLRGIAIEP